MDAAFPLQLLVQQSIDHSVSRWLHLRSERFRGNDESEMGFSGHAALHSLVVGMFARVIVYLQRRRFQNFVELGVTGQTSCSRI